MPQLALELDFGALYFRCRRVLIKAQLAGALNPDHCCASWTAHYNPTYDPNANPGLLTLTLTLTIVVIIRAHHHDHHINPIPKCIPKLKWNLGIVTLTLTLTLTVIEPRHCDPDPDPNGSWIRHCDPDHDPNPDPNPDRNGSWMRAQTSRPVPPWCSKRTSSP